MKSSILHQQTTSGNSSASSCYELDADRYPTLGNEFFTRLREKYPRAFQRTIPRHADQSSSFSSTSSAADVHSIWSLWECNGDLDRAVVKEAGGILVPISDVSVYERLKHNCDCYRSVKETGAGLIETLRSLRTALQADSHSVIGQNVAEDGDVDHSGYDGGVDAGANSSESNLASQNSSGERELILDVHRDDSEGVGVSSVQSVGVSLSKSGRVSSIQSVDVSGGVSSIQSVGVSSVQPLGVSSIQPTETELDSEAGIDEAATSNITNAEDAALEMQSVDIDASNPASNSSLLHEKVTNQLASCDEMRRASDDDNSPSVEPIQTVIDHRCEESEAAVAVDSIHGEQQDDAANNATMEEGFADDNSAEIQQQQPFIVDEHQLDTLSESFGSLTGHQIVIDRKPPLMKKEKTRQRNIRSLFGERAGNPGGSISSFAAFNDGVPEVPRSAEMTRRKLRLPWKKKDKKRYMPGEELSRWRSNFDSWLSTSQSSLESESAADGCDVLRTFSHSDAVERGVLRTCSHSELQNVDTGSVGWTDSDTDVMSDDPLAESFNERTRRLFMLSSQSVDSSMDTQQSSGWRSSLRSSARKRLSSLQKSAGRSLRRLQKVMSVGYAEQNSAANQVTSQQTENVTESSRNRVRHPSDSSSVSSRRSDIESPRHFRPIGRVLSHNVADGMTTIELIRPPHGPYGIYLARDGEDALNTMYISRLSDGLPAHFYAGLLRVGDEVREINGTAVSGLSLDEVFDMIALSSKLVLQLRPLTPAAL